jgi:hypothetical protein
MPRLALLATLGALLVGAAPAAAAEGWSAPQPLGAPGGGDGQLAADAFGNVLAVWRDGGAVLSAWRPPEGVFGAPEVVATGVRADAYPQALITPRGEVAVAWADAGGRILARWGLPGEALNPPQVVGSGVYPRLAADGHGTLLLSWTGPYDPPSPASVAERPLGGRFGAARRFGTAAGVATLAVNAAGHAAVKWRERGDGLRLATRTPGGEWNGGEKVPFTYATLEASFLDIDERGTVSVVASPFAGGPYFRSWLLRRDPSGTWSSEEEVDGGGNIRGFVIHPGGEETYLVWRRRAADDDGSGDTLGRVRRPDGTLGDAQILAERAGAIGIVDNARGDVLATVGTWHGIRVTERRAGTAFDAPVTLAEGDVAGGVPALSASGAAAVGWYQGAYPAQVWTVAARDAPGGLAAAVAAHADALAGTLDPVVAVGRIPAVAPGAPAVKVPVVCSETCALSVTAGGARAATTYGRSPLVAPGKRTVVRVRVTRRMRRALRAGGRVRVTVRARGYSQRVAKARRAVRVR